MNLEDGMSTDSKYSINLQSRFGGLQLIDVRRLVNAPIIKGGGHEQ